MKVYNIPIATVQSASPVPIHMNANFASFALQCYNIFGYSIQVEYTGTPTGTFKLQCSSDPVPQGSSSDPLTGGTPTNWTDIANSSVAVVAAGNYAWNVSDVMYNWVRLVYTDTSGGTSTATFNARYNGKGI